MAGGQTTRLSRGRPAPDHGRRWKRHTRRPTGGSPGRRRWGRSRPAHHTRCPRSPGVATTSRQLSGPAIRSTARLAYGAARIVAIPARSGVPTGDRERQVRVTHAVQQDPVRCAEQLTLGGVVADGRRPGLVDLRPDGQPAAASSRTTALSVRARASTSAPSPRPLVYGPVTSLLDGPVGQRGGRPPGVHRPVLTVQAAVGDRVEPGRLLGADGRLDERITRRALGQRRARESSEERCEHGRGRATATRSRA